MILGRISIPSKQDMIAASAPWIEREAGLATDEDMIRFQGSYVQELIDETDYPSFDIEGVNQLFLEWEHHKHEDIMGFRNNSYRYI